MHPSPTCPPCSGTCRQGRTCPARRVTRDTAPLGLSERERALLAAPSYDAAKALLDAMDEADAATRPGPAIGRHLGRIDGAEVARTILRFAVALLVLLLLPGVCTSLAHADGMPCQRDAWGRCITAQAAGAEVRS